MLLSEWGGAEEIVELEDEYAISICFVFRVCMYGARRRSRLGAFSLLDISHAILITFYRRHV